MKPFFNEKSFDFLQYKGWKVNQMVSYYKTLIGHPSDASNRKLYHFCNQCYGISVNCYSMVHDETDIWCFDQKTTQ